MAYNASSKKIPIVKFAQSEAVQTAKIAQGVDKPIKEYTAEVLKSFINDISKLLSESNFEYKKILLDEFFTLLKNYKVATSEDLASSISKDLPDQSSTPIVAKQEPTPDLSTNNDTIPQPVNTKSDNSDIIKYIESNILTSLTNILTLLNSNNSELVKLVEDAFTKFKNENDNSLLLEQFKQINSDSTSEIIKSISENLKNSNTDTDNTSSDTVVKEKTPEELLEEYSRTIKEEFVNNNKTLLNDVKKYISDSTGSIVTRLKQSNKALLSNSVAKLEKTVNDRTFRSKFKDDQSEKKFSITKFLDDKLLVKKSNDPLKNLANKLNAKPFGNIYTLIRERQASKKEATNSKDSSSILNLKSSKKSPVNTPKVSLGKNIKPKGTIAKASGKTGKSFITNILKGVKKVFTGVLKTLINPIKPFLNIGKKLLARLMGGPIGIIIGVLIDLFRNPFTLSLIALAAAFINVKVIRPIKRIWDKYVAPLIPMITNAISAAWDWVKQFIDPVLDIINRIKVFIGDIFEMGLGPALEKLWEYLKEKVPVMLKEWLLQGILAADSIYSKFIAPAINAVDKWFYKYIVYPTKTWFYEKIYNPFIEKVLSPMKKAYHTAMSLIYNTIGNILVAIGRLGRDDEDMIAAGETYLSKASEHDSKALESIPTVDIKSIETPEQYAARKDEELAQFQQDREIGRNGLKEELEATKKESQAIEEKWAKIDQNPQLMLSDATKAQDETATKMAVEATAKSMTEFNVPTKSASVSPSNQGVSNQNILDAINNNNNTLKTLAEKPNKPNTVVINKSTTRNLAPTYGYMWANQQ